MKENHATVRADRLDRPVETLYAGRLSSAVLVVGGDVPDDVEALSVLVGRTADPETGEARENLVAAASRRDDGTFRCYLSPFYFPDASDALSYHLVAADAEGGARWLGTGALVVLENPAEGSGAQPSVVPADTYVRNPVTGLYHKVLADVDEDGNITIGVEQEGVEK